VKIELAMHDGLWMYGTAYDNSTNFYHTGYRVGPKWGRFSQTRDEAISLAKKELEEIAVKREHFKEATALLNTIH
jgi:hypothetical protein